MAVLLKSMEYASSSDGDNFTELDDVISLSARKGLEIKNNILKLTLKNANGKYVGSDGALIFKENDKLNLYLKDTTDGADIGSSTWRTSDQLVGEYFIQETSHNSSSDQRRVGLDCVDKAYVLFNKAMAKSYGLIDIYTSPGIFRSVVRSNSDSEVEGKGFQGTDNDGGWFQIDARFVSEGGNILDYRAEVNTTITAGHGGTETTITVADTTGFKDNGTIVVGTEHIVYTGKTSTTFTGCTRAIDDTVAETAAIGVTVYQGFPITDMSKIWKPLYEWLSELGQTSMTNYPEETEEGSTPFYPRAFLLWIDKDNGINFQPADDTVDLDVVLEEDETYECSLTRSVFDAVNMVIYNSGEDMNGTGVTWYYFNNNTDIAELKMRYQPMIDITTTLIQNDLRINTSRDTTKTADTYKQYPLSSTYPLSDWGFKSESNRWRCDEGESLRTEINSDSEYNESLREAAKWRGKRESTLITTKMSGLRFKGTLTLKGRLVNPGDLIRLTDSKTGIANQLLRVHDVTQSVSKTQWSTNLSVEEDEKTV